MAMYDSLKIEEVLGKKSLEIRIELKEYQRIFNIHQNFGCSPEENEKCFACLLFEYLEINGLQKNIYKYIKKKKINIDIMRTVNIFLFRLKYTNFQLDNSKNNLIIEKVKNILHKIQSFFEDAPILPPRRNIPKS